MKPGNTMKTLFLFAILVILSGIGHAQGTIPEKPNPPRLVNDFAQILSPEQLQSLESKLVAFSDSTTVQIVVVIVPSLGGMEKADFANQLGEKWGVGGSKSDNGFVVLVKPKTASENGAAFISTGYGVEALVPDATAFDIVDKEMIPAFRQNDYYGGINAATNVLMSLMKGEFKADAYGKKNKKGSSAVFVLIIILVIIFLISRNNNNHRTINRSGAGGAMLFPWLMMGGGGFGGGSGGGGGGFGGGGGGGFGGFGGGSFGGGGAGGSW